MGESILFQLGLGGLLAYVIIKEVLNFLKTRVNGNGRNGNGRPAPPPLACALGRDGDPAAFNDVHTKVRGIYDMFHAVDPSDGSTQFGRYVRKAMQDAGLTAILEANQAQTALLQAILKELQGDDTPRSRASLDDTSSFRRSEEL